MFTSARALFWSGCNGEQPMISWTSINGAPYTQVLLTKDCPIFMHAPADTDPIAIRARNVTLSLGTREAPVEILKGIDLDIARNESIAILEIGRESCRERVCQYV